MVKSDLSKRQKELLRDAKNEYSSAQKDEPDSRYHTEEDLHGLYPHRLETEDEHRFFTEQELENESPKELDGREGQESIDQNSVSPMLYPPPPGPQHPYP